MIWRRWFELLALAMLAAILATVTVSTPAPGAGELTGEADAVTAGHRVRPGTASWAAATVQACPPEGHTGGQGPGDGIPPTPCGSPAPTHQDQAGPSASGGTSSGDAGDGRPPAPATATVASPTPTPTPALVAPEAAGSAASGSGGGALLDRWAFGLAVAALLLLVVALVGWSRWRRRRSGYKERHLEGPDDDPLGLEAGLAQLREQPDSRSDRE